ncbi:HCL117Cp [Eremothecium sinecaudum]|uniref:HCL117Cp n=1 Tax=Eremothecium sinecaudum TaxID=45286 RepID=A0A0X8HRD4_9SACH|nr:HCL117Cp [Eremothecium sinecaudum]AMD20034.1 HCL117Cp [Eremothecium sinecaudum]
MTKAVIFSDFDGTITTKDSNDFLADKYGFGGEKRHELFAGVLEGNKSFRDAFGEMLNSISAPLDKCIETLVETIELDPGFKEMYEWAHFEGIPIIIVSSGMKPLIEAILKHHLDPKAVANIDLVANDVHVEEDGSWKIVFRDKSPEGHDKSKTISHYKARFANQEQPPMYFYCGDGVSDLSAARECDLLFAKEGKDLIKYCDKENVPYHVFSSFDDILKVTKLVIEEKHDIREFIDKASSS